MLGIIEGIVKLIFNIFKTIFSFLANIFSFFYHKIKFIFDILQDDLKTEKKIKLFGAKQKKLLKLNDEI